MSPDYFEISTAHYFFDRFFCQMKRRSGSLRAAALFLEARGERVRSERHPVWRLLWLRPGHLAVVGVPSKTVRNVQHVSRSAAKRR